MRKYGRTDHNHQEIKVAFERMGCSVLDLSSVGGGCPDLLVGYGGKSILIEVKDGAKPPSARKLTPDEEDFGRGWKGAYAIVENLDDAQEIVKGLRQT